MYPIVHGCPAPLSNSVSVNAAADYCTDVPGGGQLATISSAICEGLLAGSGCMLCDQSGRLPRMAAFCIRNTQTLWVDDKESEMGKSKIGLRLSLVLREPGRRSRKSDLNCGDGGE